MTNRKPSVAILGGGLAGSLLANLLETVASVTLLERGPARDVEWPEYPVMPGRPLGLYPSFGYGVGGTSNLWRGGMTRMFEGEYGPEWPDHLQQELPNLARAVVSQLYGERAGAAFGEQPERQVADNAWLSTVFYPHQRFDNVLRMSGRGDLALRTSASVLCAGSELVTGARVHRLEEASGKGVTVHWFDRAGDRHQRTFDFVIVSGGAMNSPGILQRSGMGGKAVGQNYTDHPMGYVGKLIAPKNREVFDPLAAKSVGYEDSKGTMKIRDPETGLWSVFNIRPASRSKINSDPYERACKLANKKTQLQRYLGAIPGFFDRDFLYQAIENRTDNFINTNAYYALIVNEQEALGQGSVHTLDADRPDGGRIEVDWKISDTVLGSIRRNFQTLGDVTESEAMFVDSDLRGRLWSAAHHCGTCRIAVDPARGVVDPDLKVHGTERVFVCDASVVPASGASGMGLTIGQLAHRLASHLQRQFTRTFGPPTERRRVLVSGIRGRVGAMVKQRLLSSALDTQVLHLRPDTPGRSLEPGARVLLHLANASGSVEENLALHRRAADALTNTEVDQVILPLSFSTIGQPGPADPDPDAENYGFEITSPRPYPQGKLASERFWLEWQRAKPGRKLLLLYIPTILSEHVEWTAVRARHGGNRKLLVPKMEHFFAVTEKDLLDVIFHAFERGLDTPVTRRLMVSTADSLADTIRGDRREGTVAELNLPRWVWALCGTAEKRKLVGKGVSVGRVLGDKVLQKIGGRALSPISPDYLHLFRQQERFAQVILDAVRAQAERQPE